MANTEPRWITQARELFSIMVKSARLNEYEQLIWQGSLSDLYNDVGASSSHRSRIWQLLEGYEVVRLVQRGNRHQSSIVEITGELDRGELLPPDHLTETRHAATMVAESEKRLDRLEAWRDNLEKGGLDVAKVLQDYERRLAKLEASFAERELDGEKA